MPDQAITTSIDDLVNYLNVHGETESEELAESLGVSQEMVETWSGILERANIVKISYRVGKMYVTMAVSKKTAESAVQSIGARKNTVDMQIAEQVELISQVNSKIEEFRKYVTNIESVYRSKAGEVKKVMDRIDAYTTEIKRTETKLKESKEFIDKFYERLNKELEALAQRSDAIESILSQREAKGMLDDFKARLDDMENHRKDVNKQFEKELEEQRRRFVELSEDMNKESKTLTSVFNELGTEIESYGKAREAYSDDLDKIRRIAGKEGQKILDNASKTSQEVDRIYSVTEKNITQLNSTLEGIRNRFPEAAKLNDQLSDIKKSVDDLSKQKDEIAGELQEIQMQMGVLMRLGEGRLGTKLEMMSDIEDKIKDTGVKGGKLRKGIERCREQA